MKITMNTRAIATLALFEVLLKKQSLTEILPKFKSLCSKTEDAAFVQALCFGVLRYFPRLKWIALQLLHRPFKQKDEDILLLICVGLYQLTELKTATHAAISETVEATRQLKKPWASGVVNASLRHYLRQKETLSLTVEQNEEAQYAHPLWLINIFKKAWPKDIHTILTANNTQAPLVLRVNLQKIQREHYLAKLVAQNIEAKLVPGTTAGILLETAEDVGKLPGFYEGLVSVQDGAAQWAAELLDLAKGQRVLDACAAPGGKTAHILEKEPELLELQAIDISPDRNARVFENLNRLHLKANIITADAKQPALWWDGQLFDRILLDAPCSATGVIRRHPDIKFLRQINDITQLAEQQLCLLQALWPLLKPNGSLLYATCSILPAENTEVIEKFLSLENTAVSLPISIPWGYPMAVGHQLLPGQNQMDGFYYARIGKKA